MTAQSSKVAVITGAASGIGQGLAYHAVKNGFDVVLADINIDRLGQIQKNLDTHKVRSLIHKVDVSDAHQIQELAQLTMDMFGRVDLLFNNAGVFSGNMAWMYDHSDWQWVMGVNFYGVVNGIKSFLPFMLEKNDRAHIINTASTAGLVAGPMAAAYHASKAAVVALSESLYYDLEQIKSPVRVSVLCPGPVATDILENSERDRKLQDEENSEVSADLKAFKQLLKDSLNHGMTPEKVAKIVFEAVRDEKFWIFIDESYCDSLKARTAGILGRINPVHISVV